MIPRRTVLMAFAGAGILCAQAPQRPPQFVSPEVQPDRRIVFRIHAPQAQNVLVGGTDIPGNQKGTPLTKGENGVWEGAVGPVDPGPIATTSTWTVWPSSTREIRR